MKKLFLALSALIIIAIFAVYIVVPKKINATQTIRIKCTAGAANRYLLNDNNWYTWWPHNPPAQTRDPQKQLSAFTYNGYTYEPRQKMFNGVGIIIKYNGLTVNSTLMLVPLNNDTVALQWQSQLGSSNNPFSRIQRYRQAVAIKKNTAAILEKMKQYLEKNENVYGISIQKTTVKDSFLLVTQHVFDSLPSTQHVYSLINKLIARIAEQGALETGYPMLNIRTRNNTHFETMVAIPVNKKISEQKDFMMKRLVAGNILVAEVRGGFATTTNALVQMENYLSDHHLESPAIPFYSLITNRLTEPDTTKWITRINYPVL